MMITRRHTHDVARGSNLDLLLRGFHGVANRAVDALMAIAVALSTPHDNSSEVQAQIDKATEQLKSSTNALDAAVKAHDTKQQ